jgi:RNA polymerase sigma-70 factor (ECF subfamily)
MDPQQLTARELVQLCLAAKDEALWREFVRRFRPLITGVIIKRIRRHTGIVHNPSLIDDLTQDTYVKLCTNNFKPLRAFDFQHENALFGFLKVVAANVVEDYIRSSHSQKRGQGREEEDFDQIDSITPPRSPDSVERRILMEEIKKCLQEQAAEPNFARDYAIFWLYYRQGLTANEIAELPSIGLTVKGVESTLLRLTRMVREKLGRQPGRKRAFGA